MKKMTFTATIYILCVILIRLGLVGWMAMEMEMDWSNTEQYLLSVLGAAAQTLKVEGPNDRTNYSIAWFVYGFAFIAFGLEAAMIVIVIAHLVDWGWHRYQWFIQGFNIGNHLISIALAGLVFGAFSQGTSNFDLNGALGMVVASLVFIFGNHFLVGTVVNLARGQSIKESGVFELLTLSLDFTVLTLGTVTALVWSYNPLLALMNIPLIYPLYHAIRMPALQRQLAEIKN